ncbi:hypothetical protein [Leptotrichia hofstadii]|uniref:Uncharacterized protein n=1 Tax=Leptotrichia hofstadii F0254 TaxID=634994 RepID=C9MY06_9FUSO|nr:hypothetical protein [Leptotrichia hofstadii]EEX74386.1 hypothetical protein GCWU000323_01428 [Leptotrichia hofstadii F0254]
MFPRNLLKNPLSKYRNTIKGMKDNEIAVELYGKNLLYGANNKKII